MKILSTILACLLVMSVLVSCSNHEHASFYTDGNGQVQLEGIILNIPDGSNLELALFALDDDDRPERLITSEHYKGIGNALTFRLDFNLKKIEPFSAIELRGRVTQSGKLVGYLIPWYKKRLTKQDLKGIILELANTET